MSNKNGNKLVGNIFLVGILVVIVSLTGAINAMMEDQFAGAGILMLAAALPVAAAISGILKISNRSVAYCL